LDDPQLDADVFCWIDDDMVELDCMAAVQMCVEAKRVGGIVAAASMQRKPQGIVNCRFEAGEIPFFEGGRLVSASSVGTGLCAVAREVFREFAQRLPRLKSGHQGPAADVIPFYECITKDGYWFGEDTSFCVRAREWGFPIYVDSRVRVGHLGDYAYHLEDSAQAVVRYQQLTINNETGVEPDV